ncbi:MAG: FAD-dependent thymidylate synthase [Oscillospiraceae bacterium]
MPTVKLLTYTPEPEKIIAAAAKLCYSQQSIEGLLDNLTPEKTEKFVDMLVDMGHESPIEHISFTFGIEGVSRSLLAQITRHRIASYSVQSQRYVKFENAQFVIPPQIEECHEAIEIYNEALNKSIEYYTRLSDILKERNLALLLEQGIPQKKAESMAEKKAIEDARYVLPNGCETKMIVTMNARSLLNFFNLRCCNRAQWEIRRVAEMMLVLVKEVAPVIFKNAGPPCVHGDCTEGKMSCGKACEVRLKYKKGDF